MKRATITYIKDFSDDYSDEDIYQILNELIGQNRTFVDDNLKIENYEEQKRSETANCD